MAFHLNRRGHAFLVYILIKFSHSLFKLLSTQLYLHHVGYMLSWFTKLEPEKHQSCCCDLINKFSCLQYCTPRSLWMEVPTHLQTKFTPNFSEMKPNIDERLPHGKQIILSALFEFSKNDPPLPSESLIKRMTNSSNHFSETEKIIISFNNLGTISRSLTQQFTTKIIYH